MHYYRFNIKEWSHSTHHLTPEEEGVYFRLINYYYDSEKPIPLETHSVFRRLQIACVSDVATQILEEFFNKTEKGFTHSKCDEIIKDYKKNTKTNRENGRKGGRPRKHKACRETEKKPDGFISETDKKPNDNPNDNPSETLTTNHKPLTTKQKPITTNVDYSVFGMSDQQVSELIRIRKKNKGGAITDRVAKALAKEFHNAGQLGYSFDESLTEWEVRGWKSFKSEWLTPKQTGASINGVYSQDVSRANQKSMARISSIKSVQLED